MSIAITVWGNRILPVFGGLKLCLLMKSMVVTSSIKTREIAPMICFIIDPDGIVQGYEVLTPQVGRNVNETFRQVKAFHLVRETRGGEATPSGWQSLEGVEDKHGL